MKKLFEPNFEKCNLNVSATLAEFLHAPNNNATLPMLTKELEKDYRNVVFMCFDGLGIYPMQQNLPKTDFLWQHLADTLLAPFPSTTANATTSLGTNTLPLEHGWFGWSVHFPALNKNINVFLDEDSWTGEKVDTNPSPLEHFPYYFDLAQTEREINTVFPAFVNVAHPERNTIANDIDDFFEAVNQICHRDGKHFVYSYCAEPDHTMHEVGVTCPQAKALIQKISQGLETLASRCSDTLFIVTADHGQIDVNGYVDFQGDTTLMNMLKIYPYIEPRAVAFLVKDGMHEQFAQYFKQKYSEDFELVESKTLVEKGYFGNRGDKAYLLGDFIALGNYSHKIAILAPPSHPLFLGHHTGLTEEMLVPLILVSLPKQAK